MKLIDAKIQMNLQYLKDYIIELNEEINNIQIVKSGYKKNNTPPENGWEPFSTNTFFSNHDEHFWFHMNFHTPKVDENKAIFFQMSMAFDDWDSCRNPQGLVYINGKMVQGLDMNHRIVLLEPDADIDMYCYFYTGLKKVDFKFIPSIIVKDKRTERLYYDIATPFEAAKLYQDNELKTEIFKHLEIALNYVDLRNNKSEAFYNSIEKAQKYITEEFYEKCCKDNDILVDCIGHTHIDVAWEWTYAQTKEKAQRSFSTVLNLMKQYPEYKFMSSQPELYAIVKEEAPELYEEIKQRIAEGRWEAEGGMWLECDCNLTDGESLVRQIVYGKRFMQKEFGKDNKVLWLPDTFGYSAALPQILNKCGIKHFVTSKISWNESNTMPHDTFMWEGIDGSEIFTNFITCQHFSNYDFRDRFATYNAFLSPPQILGTWARYHDKKYNNATIMPFGHGDGGGGPTFEMLEYQRRTQKGIPGLPQTKITTAGEHLDMVADNFARNAEALGYAPKWVGELYLELHRGTYTSIGKNKRNNRKSEFSIASAEFVSSAAMSLLSVTYPQESLLEAWRLIQINQFHDILPGSSIKEVYDDSDKDYEKIFNTCDNVKCNAINSISNSINTEGGTLVVNATGFKADGYVKIDGETVEVKDVPAFGWTVVENPIKMSCVICKEKSLENRYYNIKFDDNGDIVSIFDKRYNREVVTAGKTFNNLCVFEDIPRSWDNWEINEYYKCKKWPVNTVKSFETIKDGSRAGFKIVREYQNSVIEQKIWIYSELDRIDFETFIDWNEHHQILKAFFPVNVHTNKATYDIQYGNVERPTHQNTDWDQAKFEVCAQKWADLSDANYGVTLMNDCKYGHSCVGSEMALTLLRCGTFPNPEADQGKHVFTYSIVPHGGSFREANIYAKAYMLNQPLMYKEIKANKGSLAKDFSLISCDSSNVVINTVKKAEDDDSVIIRLFESYDITKDIKLICNLPFSSAVLCDMLENEISNLEIDGNSIKYNIKNFEIVTIKLKK